MARKKDEINPLCGPRLKELLALQNMTQKDLANRLNYTEQHISLIVQGKRRMTLEMAQDIVNLFPDGFRVEWLMGKDDYRTQFDYKSKINEQSNWKRKTVYDFMKMIAEDKGCKLYYDDESGLFVISSDGKNLDENTSFFFLGDGTLSYECTQEDYAEFCSDVCLFASTWFEKLLLKASQNRFEKIYQKVAKSKGGHE